MPSTFVRPTVLPLSCSAKVVRLRYLPTANGQSHNRRNHLHSWAHWFPDGKRVLFAADEPGKGVRFYVYEVESGKSQVISHEGVNGTAFMISPDSKQIAAI